MGVTLNEPSLTCFYMNFSLVYVTMSTPSITARLCADPGRHVPCRLLDIPLGYLTALLLPFFPLRRLL